MPIDVSDITVTKLVRASVRSFCADIENIPPQMIVRILDINCERIRGMASFTLVMQLNDQFDAINAAEEFIRFTKPRDMNVLVAGGVGIIGRITFEGVWPEGRYKITDFDTTSSNPYVEIMIPCKFNKIKYVHGSVGESTGVVDDVLQ